MNIQIAVSLGCCKHIKSYYAHKVNGLKGWIGMCSVLRTRSLFSRQFFQTYRETFITRASSICHSNLLWFDIQRWVINIMKLNWIGLIYHLGVIGLKCILKVVDNGSLVKIKFLVMVTNIIEKNPHHNVDWE